MSGVRLRPAVAGDASALADVHLAARISAAIPNLHDGDDVRAYHGRLIANDQVMVAEIGGRPVGYAAVREDWLEHLWIEPAYHRQGIGTKLLAWARESVASDLKIYVFTHNVQAIAFYRAHGAVEIASSDGRGNEERLPDLTLLIRKA